jgi:mannose-binding lectin 1
MWSDKATSSQDWTAQLEFRASGQEMGSGNLQLWYTSSRDSVVTSSVYNAEKFDGLVLVIDQYGRSGGKIRGFLNDGGVDFRSTMNLESLAFGHCDYNYRNLGRPSKLRVSHQGGLTVTVDDKTCFSSDKISLPAGYYFGITATTGEDPDSFELQKFIVTAGGQPVSAPSPTQQTQQQQQPPHTQKMDKMPGAPEFIPDRDADQIKSTSDQFADVHNRLQALSHHMGTLYYEFKEMSDKIDAKHTEVVSLVNNIKGSKDTGLPPDTVGKISTMNDRVTNIEALVNLVKQDIEGKDYKENLDELHRAMSFLHHNFHTKLDDKMEFGGFPPFISMRQLLTSVFFLQPSKLIRQPTRP